MTVQLHVAVTRLHLSLVHNATYLTMEKYPLLVPGSIFTELVNFIFTIKGGIVEPDSLQSSKQINSVLHLLADTPVNESLIYN